MGNRYKVQISDNVTCYEDFFSVYISVQVPMLIMESKAHNAINNWRQRRYWNKLAEIYLLCLSYHQETCFFEIFTPS